MIGFFLKKAFYDGWDNLLQILVLNLLFLVIGVGGVLLAQKTASVAVFSIAVLVCAGLAECVLLVAASTVLAGVAGYQSFSFKELLQALRETWKHGLLLGAVIAVFSLVVLVTIPYYMALGNMVGLIIAIVLFWTVITLVLSFQWFLAIRGQLEKNFIKCVRKSFLLFFDNPGFSIFLFVYSLVLLALSVVMIFLVPGVMGILLAQNNALRLRLYKYDWLEQHPELDYRVARKSVPWSELIAEDEETVGTRSLKSFIFPWKD